jgi:hypothetical protein
MVYVWSTTYTTTPTKQSNTGRISLDSYKKDAADPSKLTVYIRNIGLTRVTINHIFVNGTEPPSTPSTPFHIYPGSITEVSLSLTQPFNSGTNLKISFDTSSLEQTISP